MVQFIHTESPSFQKMFKKYLHGIWSMNTSVKMFVVLIFTVSCLPCTYGVFRYTRDSCSDLIPKQISDRPANYEIYQPDPTMQSTWRNNKGRDKRSDGTYGHQSPYKLTVPGYRYRKNAELNVQIEGNGFIDGLMVQGRGVSSTGEFIPGGVGLVGRFDPQHLLRRNFSYIECFRYDYGTIVDNGAAPMLGNVSFVWTAPNADTGSIRFVAGVTRGINYWVLISNILHFNPFPISTTQCGGVEACFRVCPLDNALCDATTALVMYNYNTDLQGKKDVEFTLGGNIDINQSYLAVVYAADNDNLYQADVVVCYVERGRAYIAHLYLETAETPLYQHSEELSLDDYDVEGNMLWCRYRRPISHSSIINPWQNFYTLLFRGELGFRSFPKFISPSRGSMYSSDMKMNLTTAVNKIYAGSMKSSQFQPVVLILTQIIALHMSLCKLNVESLIR